MLDVLVFTLLDATLVKVYCESCEILRNITLLGRGNSKSTDISSGKTARTPYLLSQVRKPVLQVPKKVWFYIIKMHKVLFGPIVLG